MSIRVLIIDDSATMRAILMTRLSEEHDICVIGTAANAVEGRELIKRFNPDVVTLDIEMPGMNGLDFLEKIMQLRPTPVIIVSGATQAGNEIAARALALGAIDCYAKSDQSDTALDDHGRLAAMIREAAQVRFNNRWPVTGKVSHRPQTALPGDSRLIAIGSSTGGVEALQVLLAQWPADCPPTMIVQHVNARFAPAIAHTLDTACPAKVVLAEADMPVKPGHVYLAPGGDKHMRVGGSARHFVKLRSGPPISGHSPSVDALFESVAATFANNAVGILLTGMGSDGARGLLAMANAGARTIAQDEASCTVFGMPRAAISLGAAQIIAPIGRIARHAFQRAA